MHAPGYQALEPVSAESVPEAVPRRELAHRGTPQIGVPARAAARLSCPRAPLRRGAFVGARRRRRDRGGAVHHVRHRPRLRAADRAGRPGVRPATDPSQALEVVQRRHRAAPRLDARASEARPHVSRTRRARGGRTRPAPCRRTRPDGDAAARTARRHLPVAAPLRPGRRSLSGVPRAGRPLSRRSGTSSGWRSIAAARPTQAITTAGAGRSPSMRRSRKRICCSASVCATPVTSAKRARRRSNAPPDWRPG